ncbi:MULTISPECIES: hypothetical protein [unclassified Rhizobium]|uniref:hypothetical protein n=1 Tax=unclassified Rhizobium TaxID=2613769 RepID=UPI000CDF3C07|nr:MULTISPECIES: hypothetical protein [Rhizobium]AVA22305.1 hypothetical protein NXC24_CH02674 [Rhizobium sp. NXC24]UWU19747.1 hypothetical protein N2601_10520 [Rhizobium tropici]
MSDLKTALEGAAGEGIISSDQASRLLPYLAERNIGIKAAAVRNDLSQPREDDIANPLEDSEAPRFIRGFHDVLITIGIIVLLSGLWGLAGYYATLPAIIILAEILVRRQRLALPAVVLTIALVCLTFWAAVTYFGTRNAASPGLMTSWIMMALPLPPLLALYYWRYRVPLSLAMLLFSLFVLMLAGVFYLIGLASGASNVVLSYPLQSFVIMFTAALGAFAVAMRFDLSDPDRRTRRSDVAFWLHLVTAPALLYTAFLLVFQLEADRSGAFFAGTEHGTYVQALTIVAIVVVMMLIGLIIDRRAFVTAGLMSLGVAIGAILRQNNAGLDKVSFIVLMIVGLIVLVIGVGWPHLRRAVVRLLPASVQGKLPALR